MKIDLRDVTVRWVNVDSDTEKNKMMEELCDRVGFKNASRFSAVTGIDPHEGVIAGEEHYRNCAESHFKIYEETDSFPLLILEDDVEIEESVFTYNLDNVPDDADAIYLGTSHGDGRYSARDVGNGWMRVERVFATHSILYLNKRICEKVIEVGKHWIYELNRPFDVGFAYHVQPHFNVYSPHIPFFYQADSKNTKNKWEKLTRTPLQHKKKFSVFTT
tara:strand:+ start:14278 stop:14931 length:654 start_codon:yes stop_codon:yes gene_type:complete